MYIYLKKIIKFLLPPVFLGKLDGVLRSAYSLLYKGSNVSCPVCERSFREFILLENKRDTLCPNCGSLPRNRLLWILLRDRHQIENHSYKLLHFSPARSLKKKLKKLKNISYTSTDYCSQYEDKQHDITNIKEPDNSYNLIICYHVLEHIPDDVKAIRELFRILAPGGVAFIQTPFKDGEIYENTSITDPLDRLKHFGQEDHVRIYSLNGLKSRLGAAGFSVTVVASTEVVEKGKLDYFGIKKDEKILMCRK